MLDTSIVLVLTAAALGAAAPRAIAAQALAWPNFAEHVAPLVFAHCASCHRPGQAAPFSLLSFADVRRRGKTIARVVAGREMPPWHPVAGHGSFAGQARLSDEAIATVLVWVEGGMPVASSTRPSWRRRLAMPPGARVGVAMTRVAASVLLLAAACATPIPAITVVHDIDGVRQAPLDARPGHLHVVIFVTADCPIANAYAPTIQALRTHFASQPVRFFLVHVDEQFDAARARQHAAEYGLVGPTLLDPSHDLVRALGVTITPEVVVLGSARSVLYQGRIDNWFGDLGKKRPQPTRHDLRDAIHALLAGAEVVEGRTVAIGCSIE